MYTIKIKKVIALIAMACAMVMPVAAQQATNTDSTSAASNSGVALTTNSTSGPSTNISAGFPSLVAGNVSISGCLSSGMELRAGGWNFLGDTTLVQKWSEECAFTPTSKTLLDSCQFLTFRLYQDAYWKKQGVDVRKSWKPKKVNGEIVGPKDYDAYLGTLDNMSFEDCMMLRMPTAAGPATPAAAPVSPAPQPPVTVNIQYPPMSAPAASSPVVTPPAVVTPVPVVRERHTREAVVALSSLTWFDSGKSKILPAGIAALTKEMSKFSPANTRVLSVVGRTDDVGAANYNQKLSEDRANAVAVQLRSMGYAVDEVIGKGKTDPIVPGTSEGARAVNRSVTITVQSTEVSSADGPLQYTRVLGSQ